MKRFSIPFFFLFFIIILHLNSLNLDKIKLPEGFKISLFAKDIITAREISVSPDGTVFVGSKNGIVYAIRDNNKDFIADRVYIIAKNLNMPVGVNYHNGDLYVSEINRILKFNNIEKNLNTPPTPIVVNDNFPNDKWHGWKFIKFGPDNKLYVPVGAPCNVCENNDKRHAVLFRMNADGSNLELFASGIRNTVGFDWHPVTKELWFTDNGRDQMGDNIPPDELNYAPKKGMNFGFPYLHGSNIRDPKFGINKNLDGFTKPAIELGPHVAALGMRFYTGKMFPKKYQNQIFIAEHGSWNRSIPIGYRITLVTLKGNKATNYEIFAEGWLPPGNKKPWGRPVDVEIYYDGSLLVSDDTGNAIYRIYYE